MRAVVIFPIVGGLRLPLSAESLRCWGIARCLAIPVKWEVGRADQGAMVITSEFRGGDRVWIRGRVATFRQYVRRRQGALVHFDGDRGNRVVPTGRLSTQPPGST